MTDEEFRTEVQRVLKAERKVTDVAFTPLPNGVEVVHFWEGDIRPEFSVNKRAIKDKQSLALLIKAQAQSAFEAKQAEAANGAS